MTLSSAFASGATIITTVTGHLAMHGTSRVVTFTISGRRDGSALQVAGSIPVALSGWGIRGPAGYGFPASLATAGWPSSSWSSTGVAGGQPDQGSARSSGGRRAVARVLSARPS